jgi:hypothetical protein
MYAPTASPVGAATAALRDYSAFVALSVGCAPPCRGACANSPTQHRTAQLCVRARACARACMRACVLGERERRKRALCRTRGRGCWARPSTASTPPAVIHATQRRPRPVPPSLRPFIDARPRCGAPRRYVFECPSRPTDASDRVRRTPPRCAVYELRSHTLVFPDTETVFVGIAQGRRCRPNVTRAERWLPRGAMHGSETAVHRGQRPERCPARVVVPDRLARVSREVRLHREPASVAWARRHMCVLDTMHL